MAEEMAGAGPANPMGPAGPAGPGGPGAARGATGSVRGGEPGAADRTGDARVDEAIAPLDGLADVPLEDHPAIFERIHDRLREVLGELNPGPSGPGSSAAPSGPPGIPGRAGPP